MIDLFDFLNASPTAFQVIENVANELENQCFMELSEGETWRLSKSRKCYVKRNGSSLIAFAIPEKEIKGFHVFSAHSDSPAFRIKENTELVFEENYVRLNVEKYGGMILPSWFDRPLSIAGRVVVRDGDALVEKNINIDRDLCVIPNVAIHMKSDLNKDLTYSVQTDLLPLFGDFSSKGAFDSMVADAAGVKKEDVLGRDLFLYARQKAERIGAGNELIISPHLDDQACVYAGLKGLLDSEPGEYVRVLAVFDNEEVGSGTKQGADSTFLEDTLFRIAESLSYSRTDYLKLISQSFNISADNAHAVHPALPSKADPTARPYLNKGMVLKFNGNQRYATDAVSAAYFRKLCADNGLKVQNYSNNSDIAGGSTLGNISTSHVSLKTVDIGLPQLAMHSAVETMGASDYEDMIKLAKAYFEE